MGRMRILDESGDRVVNWNADQPDSVEQAAAVFTEMTSKCRIPFARSEGAPASEATRIRTFDPAAEEIIWVRPIQGG